MGPVVDGTIIPNGLSRKRLPIFRVLTTSLSRYGVQRSQDTPSIEAKGDRVGFTEQARTRVDWGICHSVQWPVYYRYTAI
jgi:hypothetical protein